MVKALARAFRWRKMLDEAVHGTLEDLAKAKGVAPFYVSRVLRLTLLALEIVEAFLDGRQPAALQVDAERASALAPNSKDRLLRIVAEIEQKQGFGWYFPDAEKKGTEPSEEC